MHFSFIMEVICILWVGGVLLIGLFLNGDKLYSWVGVKFGVERDYILSTLDLMFVQTTPIQVSRYYTAYLVFLFALGVFFLYPSIGGGFFFGCLFT